MEPQTVPGWYRDPSNRFEVRWWDGRRWSAYVARSGQQLIDLPDVTAVRPGPEIPVGAVRAYLADAEARGLLDDAARRRLAADLDRWDHPSGPPTSTRPPPALVEVPGARRPVPAPAQGPTGWAPRPPLPPPPAPTPPRAPAPARPPLPPPPSWAPAAPPPRPGPPPPRTRPRWVTAIGADLAIHGLVYVGVAFVFAGLLGLVLFAFGDVGPALRPVAELAVPLTAFVAAALLRRRQAPFVAGALELLAGALLPVVVVAAFVDGVAPPPDLTGPTLVGAIATANVAIAGAYTVVVHRRPDSALRFLVAPALWVAVAALGLLLSDPIPAGAAVSRPTAAQWALVTVAVAASVVAARGTGAVARGTRTAARPGLLLAEVLVLLGTRPDWPSGPAQVSAAAVVIGLDRLADRRPRHLTVALQLLTLAVTAVVVAPSLGAGWTAAGVALGALAVADRAAGTDRSRGDVVASLVMAAAALLVTPVEPVAAWTAGAAAWGWAVVARGRPRPALPSAVVDAGVAAVPVIVGAGLVQALPPAAATVAVAAAVAAVAAAVRATRTPDGLWAGWVVGYGSAVVLVAMGAGLRAEPAAGAVAAASAAAVLATAPRWPVVRVWTAVAAAATALGLAATALDLTRGSVGLLVAVAGLAGVLVAATTRRTHLGHLGVLGHLVSLVGLGMAWGAPDPGWSDAAAAILVAAGFAVTATVEEVGGSSVGDLLDRTGTAIDPRLAAAGPARRALPAVLTVVATPVALAIVLADAGAWWSATAWTLVPGAALLAGAGAASRVLVPAHLRVARAVVRVGFWVILASGVVAALTDQDPGPALVCGVALLVDAVVAPPAARHPSLRWGAWSSTPAVLWLAADASGIPAPDRPLVLVGWGAALLVGALLVDDLVEGRRPRGAGIRRPAGVAPAVVGATTLVVAGTAVALVQPVEVTGWVALAVAAVVALVALQLRAWIVTTVSWLLLALAALLLAPSVREQPTAMLVLTTVLLVIAAVTDAGWIRRLLAAAGRRPTDPPRPWWGRPALAPFVAAHPTALAAVVVAGIGELGDGSDLARTLAAVGALALAVGAWRRGAPWTWPWVGTGITFEVIALLWAGDGWIALTLGVAAVVLTAASVAMPGRDSRSGSWVRAAGVACAVGSFGALASWADWSVEQAARTALLAAGALALLLGAVARATPVPRSWLATWAGLPVLGLLPAVLVVVPPSGQDPATLAPVAGLALAAAALGAALAAAPTRVPLLREVAAVLAVLASCSVAVAAGAGGFPTGGVAVLLAVGLVATIAAVALVGAGVGPSWVRPAVVLAASTTALALVPAFGAWPARGPLAAVLLLAGAETAVTGLLTDRAALRELAPVLLGAGWLVVAGEALAGRPQWSTTPIGLLLVAEVELERHRRRALRRAPLDRRLRLVDALAAVLVVGPAFVDTVVESPGWALLGVLLGLLVAGLGAATRLRQRFVLGAVAIVASLSLMVLVPVAGLLPSIGAWGLWAGVAAVGLVAIVAAAAVEQRRPGAGWVVARFRSVTADWD